MTRFQKALLLASLVFNAMVVIGYFATSLTSESAGSAEAAARLVGDELGLDTHQREAFLELRREADAQKAELRQAIELAHEKLVAELCKARRDPEMLRERQTALAELRDAYRELTFRHSDRFLGMLTPEQRQDVGQRLGRRGRHRRLRDAFLRRYDEDGDGELNQEEREDAIRAVRGRRGRGRRYPDGDGRPGHPRRRPPRGRRRRSHDDARGKPSAKDEK